MSLGLIQETVAGLDSCGENYRLVFDEAFKELVQPLFRSEALIFYPRTQLKRAGRIGQFKVYANLIKELRGLNPDIAIDIEGDSVSSLLTAMSGAKATVGPHASLHSGWYQKLSAPKKPHESSEYFKYRNVLNKVTNLQFQSPHYGRLILPVLSSRFSELLDDNGITQYEKLIVLHTGASKERKFWPRYHWVELVRLLKQQGFRPVLVGAGKKTAEVNNAILAGTTSTSVGLASNSSTPNLTDKLSLVELAQLLSMSRFYIGNDSGPMHLATSLGIPGIALFGPTNEKLWGPLLPNVVTMRGHPCPPSCRNGHNCHLSFSCLVQLRPQAVLDQFLLHYRTQPSTVSITRPTASGGTLQQALAGGLRDSGHSTDRPERRSAAP